MVNILLLNITKMMSMFLGTLWLSVISVIRRNKCIRNVLVGRWTTVQKNASRRIYFIIGKFAKITKINTINNDNILNELCFWEMFWFFCDAVFFIKLYLENINSILIEYTFLNSIRKHLRTNQWSWPPCIRK